MDEKSRPLTDDAKRRRRARLARQGGRDIDLGLSRIAKALAALGHPERRIPPVIHVAGTNGKGSTIAFMRAMLEAGGYAVHTFTSPALLNAEEQIVCAGKTIAPDLLDALVDEVETAAPEALTPFEALTAAAFLAFSRNAADVTLLETGLGGTADATNVIASPALCVLTPVALDHMAQLGAEVTQIARAKAGIFKSGAPAVLGQQSEDVQAVLEEEAIRRGIRLVRQGTEWMAFEQNGRLVYQDDGGLLDLPLPPLAGRHQIDNAGLAIAAIRTLAGLGLSDEDIEQGLISVRWAGRLEPIRRGIMLGMLPEGSELWLDVGHNPHAALALAEFAADRGAWDKKPLVLIAALLEGKDAAGFFKPFQGLASQLITVPLPDDSRARDPRALAEEASRAGLPVSAVPSLEQALSMVRADAQGPVRVLMCGSFGLARLVEQING